MFMRVCKVVLSLILIRCVSGGTGDKIRCDIGHIGGSQVGWAFIVHSEGEVLSAQSC